MDTNIMLGTYNKVRTIVFILTLLFIMGYQQLVRNQLLLQVLRH